MSSLMHTVADGVRAALAAGSFSLAVTPALNYETEMLLEGLTSLRCDVVPAAAQFESEDRGSARYTFGIDVGLRKKFAAADAGTGGVVSQTAIAALIELLEEMNEYLANSANRRFSGTYADAVWQGSEIRYLWIPAHLRQNHQYTGVFRATYLVDVDE